MKKQKVPLVGIMLVVIGTGLLLRRLDIIHLTFGTILWGGIGIGGAVLVVRSYLSNVRK
ncbi:MAG: hypothetical protein H3C35_09400, partial [Bacteroidetes bacterium]|nr:hypothetical protein [Bacteroidota bacterium]